MLVNRIKKSKCHYCHILTIQKLQCCCICIVLNCSYRGIYVFWLLRMDGSGWALCICICMCYVTLYKCVVCTLKCILAGYLIAFQLPGSLIHDFTYCLHVTYMRSIFFHSSSCVSLLVAYEPFLRLRL